MTDYTHYVTDPENAGKAIVFRAYACPRCHCMHMAREAKQTVMPWVIAAVKQSYQRLEVFPEAAPER